MFSAPKRREGGDGNEIAKIIKLHPSSGRLTIGMGIHMLTEYNKLDSDPTIIIKTDLDSQLYIKMNKKS